MKLRFISSVLFFILFVHHSHQQGFNFNPLGNLSNVGSNLLNGYNRNARPTDNSQPVGIVGVLRNRLTNTTNGILTRLEQPRDRVIALIRPAVKSDFSRNVTNVLNSLWNRIQESNSSIIQNPVIRTSFVRPISISLERLREITAEDNEHAEVNGSNLEIINLNNPGEEQQNLREYIIASSSNEERSAPVLLLLTNNETFANSLSSKDEIILNDDKLLKDQLINLSDNQSNEQTAEESTEQPIINEPNDQEVSNENGSSEQANQNDQNESNENEPKESNEAIEQPKEDDPNEPVKSASNVVEKRRARFMDQYTYITPDRMRNFYDRVQQNRMRECLGLAVCESNCRPHLYGGGGTSFSRLFDRVQSFNLDHRDNDYYLEARRYGQRFYSPQYFDECHYCHRRYRCEHSREQLMSSFARMGNFY